MPCWWEYEDICDLEYTTQHQAQHILEGKMFKGSSEANSKLTVIDKLQIFSYFTLEQLQQTSQVTLDISGSPTDFQLDSR